MVINQFHSIGDILFIEPICRHYWRINGEKPILPVRDHLMWLSEYIESAQLVPMSRFHLDYGSIETNNLDYLPLRFANQILRGLKPDDHSDFENMMLDKFTLAGLDHNEWKNIDLRFNESKGKELFEAYGLKEGDEYIVINELSQAGNIKIDLIKTHEDQKNFYMHELAGFSLIDWYYVILNAKENHHVSTSTFFLMQAIANKFDFKSKVFIYPRPNEDGLRGVSRLKPSYECELVY